MKPIRQFIIVVPLRRFYAPISGNRVVYDGDYPPDAFINWGQVNIQPFMPGGADSTKPFGDLP